MDDEEDEMKKLSEKQREFTLMVARFIDFVYSKLGYELTEGEAWRPQMMQDYYLKTGKSEVKHSTHQDRLAEDFNLFINGVYVTDKEKYRPLGEYWESIGGRWGGRFGVKKENYDKEVGWDAGHFEYGGKKVILRKNHRGAWTVKKSNKISLGWLERFILSFWNR